MSASLSRALARALVACGGARARGSGCWGGLRGLALGDGRWQVRAQCANAMPVSDIWREQMPSEEGASWLSPNARGVRVLSLLVNIHLLLLLNDQYII